MHIFDEKCVDLSLIEKTVKKDFEKRDANIRNLKQRNYLWGICSWFDYS